MAASLVQCVHAEGCSLRAMASSTLKMNLLVLSRPILNIFHATSYTHSFISASGTFQLNRSLDSCKIAKESAKYITDKFRE